MTEELHDDFVSATVKVFEKYSTPASSVIDWPDGINGLKYPKLSIQGWHTINDALCKVLEDFIAADQAGNISRTDDIVNADISGFAENNHMLNEWAMRSIISTGDPAPAMYFDQPLHYNEPYASVYRIDMLGFYPRILMQLYAGHYLEITEFSRMYAMVVLHRARLKLTMSKYAYALMKLYINAGFMNMVRDSAEGDRHSVLKSMVVDYARFVMSRIIEAFGEDAVIYADTDTVYVNTGMSEAQSVMNDLQLGMPYDIHYITEINVVGRKTYTIKESGGGITNHGPVERMREWHRYNNPNFKNNT